MLEYVQPDGSVRRELRPREEVAKPASLATLEGRPVTDDHPSHMLNADDALLHTRGALASGASMDGDHVYSRLSVLDRNLVRKMDDGVQQISCGYECDLDESPGVDPTYGRYDAIQRNINYNHVAILPRGRAGSARVRMDGVSVQVGDLATPHAHAIIAPVSVARTDMQKPSASAVVDPNDVANRNARGENDLDSGRNAPMGADAPSGGLDLNLDDMPDDCDAYDTSYVDGVLTAAARDKIAASNFAVPGKEKLPIHDKPHLRAAMSRFGQTDFESADEKHGAFNRIVKKGKDLGVSTKDFEAAHRNKLDRVDHVVIPPSPTQRNTSDGESTMTDAEIKKLQADLAAATARADGLEGQLASAKRDQTAGVVTEQARKDAAEFNARVGARVAVLTAATQILGATDKQGNRLDHAHRADGSERTDREIKELVIEHVDHEQVPAGKPDAYVDAMYDGAVKRFQRGDRGAAAAREVAGGGAALNAPAMPAHPAPRADAEELALTDERGARERMRLDSRNKWKTPVADGRTKAQAMKETN